MDKCSICVASKTLCEECRDNPKYKDYPHFSQFQPYIPTCPRGYTDCVGDPAYIKWSDPKWYKELYGDKTPYEAAEECRRSALEDPDEEYFCYDTEDK